MKNTGHNTVGLQLRGVKRPRHIIHFNCVAGASQAPVMLGVHYINKH